MSYRWYAQMLKAHDLQEGEDGELVEKDKATKETPPTIEEVINTQLTLLPGGAGDAVVTGTGCGSSPIIIFSDKLLKSQFEHWKNLYVTSQKNPYPTNREVWEYAALRCDSEFNLFLRRMMSADGDAFVIAVLKHGKNGREIAVRNLEFLDEAFDFPNSIAQTAYVKHGELCLEIITDFGVDTAIIREWRFTAHDADRELAIDKIIAGDTSAWAYFLSMTHPIGRHFYSMPSTTYSNLEKYAAKG